MTAPAVSKGARNARAAAAVPPFSRRRKYELLRVQLLNERSSFDAHWRELNNFILPRRGRFDRQDVNKGDRRSGNIIDSTATLAVRTLASGMTSGITSPARPWRRLTTPDSELAEQADVKEYLHEVNARMDTVLLKSNFYDAAPICYADLGVFGTHAMGMLEDDQAVVRFEPYPVGSYLLANDARMRVTAFVREFRLTVRQVVEQFGKADAQGEPDWSRFSLAIRHAWEEGRFEQWIDLVHVIAPNEDYRPTSVLSRHKPWVSCYYELAAERDDQFLDLSGFDEFPILAPRWEVTAGDVYGTNCPGMTALGDIKQLQMGERRKLQAIDKMISPPMKAPPTMMSVKVSGLPGDVTYGVDQNDAFRPVYQIQFNIEALDATQQMVRERIAKAFYEDLFLMLEQSDRREITAREIDERHEEKLLALGPVLSRLDTDFLNPMIERLFGIMDRKGMLPEPPEALHGVALKVEYLSIMAQAQKMVGLAGIDRFIASVAQFSVETQRPDVLDKLDLDEWVDVIGDMTGVPPKIIVPSDQAAATRKARSDAAQQAQATEQAATQAKTAQTLSQTDTTGDNGLTRLINMTRGA